MSDFWYRDELPPYEDWQGRLWTMGGVCLNPEPKPEVLDVDFDTWISDQLDSLLYGERLGEWSDDERGRWRDDHAR